MRWSFFALLGSVIAPTTAFTVVLAGGTGPLGQAVASKLEKSDDVIVLCRNAFLAAAPNRVSGDFGWVGAQFLKVNPHVCLRDWDGGDFMDIVGQDWVGWQEDALKKADVVVNLVGGYTEQRTMACERIVRESLALNKSALQITVSPTEKSMNAVSPGAAPLKLKRVDTCEEMVKANCLNTMCMRLEAYELDKSSDAIVEAIYSRKQG